MVFVAVVDVDAVALVVRAAAAGAAIAGALAVGAAPVAVTGITAGWPGRHRSGQGFGFVEEEASDAGPAERDEIARGVVGLGELAAGGRGLEPLFVELGGQGGTVVVALLAVLAVPVAVVDVRHLSGGISKSLGLLPVCMETAFPLVLDALWDAAVIIWDGLISPAIESWRSL